jgi:hypothetical protein
VTEPTPEQHKQLTAFHKDWHQASARLQMAMQALQGAQAEVAAKEARFKGAAEFVFGTTDVSFNYDEVTGKLTFAQPNRETRRALAKRRSKKRGS